MQLAGDALTLGLLGGDQPPGELLKLLAGAQELLVAAVLGEARSAAGACGGNGPAPGPLSLGLPAAAAEVLHVSHAPI